MCALWINFHHTNTRNNVHDGGGFRYIQVGKRVSEGNQVLWYCSSDASTSPKVPDMYTSEQWSVALHKLLALTIDKYIQATPFMHTWLFIYTYVKLLDYTKSEAFLEREHSSAHVGDLVARAQLGWNRSCQAWVGVHDADSHQDCNNTPIPAHIRKWIGYLRVDTLWCVPNCQRCS